MRDVDVEPILITKNFIWREDKNKQLHLPRDRLKPKTSRPTIQEKTYLGFFLTDLKLESSSQQQIKNMQSHDLTAILLIEKNLSLCLHIIRALLYKLNLPYLAICKRFSLTFVLIDLQFLLVDHLIVKHSLIVN